MPSRWAEDGLPRVERDPGDDHPLFFHDCNGVVRRTFLPLNHETGWWWQDDSSLMPSIHCESCGTHGWWTAEGWRPA